MIDILCAVCGTLMDIENENVDHRSYLEVKVKCTKCEDTYVETLEIKDTVIREQINWLESVESVLDEATARISELETFIDEYINSE